MRIVADGEELHEGQHQAIVDRKLWHKVQEQVEAQARTTPKRIIQYPLSKLLTCLQCGKHMKRNCTATTTEPPASNTEQSNATAPASKPMKSNASCSSS